MGTQKQVITTVQTTNFALIKHYWIILVYIRVSNRLTYQLLWFLCILAYLFSFSTSPLYLSLIHTSLSWLSLQGESFRSEETHDNIQPNLRCATTFVVGYQVKKSIENLRPFRRRENSFHLTMLISIWFHIYDFQFPPPIFHQSIKSLKIRFGFSILILKVRDGISSIRVKGVDIVLDDDIWTYVANMHLHEHTQFLT